MLLYSKIVREVPLSTYSLLVHTKLQQKPALLRGKHSEPTKTFISLKRSERSFPLYMPLTGAHKIAAKTSTFERRA